MAGRRERPAIQTPFFVTTFSCFAFLLWRLCFSHAVSRGLQDLACPLVLPHARSVCGWPSTRTAHVLVSNTHAVRSARTAQTPSPSLLTHHSCRSPRSLESDAARSSSTPHCTHRSTASRRRSSAWSPNAPVSVTPTPRGCVLRSAEGRGAGPVAGHGQQSPGLLRSPYDTLRAVVMANDDDQTARASLDEPQRRDSSSPEPFENLDAIWFGDEGDLSDEGDEIDEAENKSEDSASVTRTESTEEEEASFYDTRDMSRIDEDEDEGDGESTETDDRDSARTPSPGSCSQTTAEPASPAQSTTPIVTRTVTRASFPPSDEVIVPVVVVVEEEEPAAQEGASASQEDAVDPPTEPTRSCSTASLSDDNKATYPPSLHRKTSHIDGGNATDSTTPLPVVLATDPAPNPIHVPPDGGWRAWADVLGGFLVLFASLGLVSAFGVFQVYFVQVKAVLFGLLHLKPRNELVFSLHCKQHRYTSHTESQISWIGSCQLCLFFLLALVAGPLFDKGRFRYLIGVGSVLWTLSVFLIPEAQTYGQCMFVQGILGGLGVGLLFVPSASGSSLFFFSADQVLIIDLV